LAAGERKGNQMMRVHCLQHVPFEGLGSLAGAFAERGDRVTTTHLYREALDADPDALDLLVVMGGPMGIADETEHPWLAAEKRFIAQVIDNGARVLGVCLGAQLIAGVLNAPVTRNPQPEIGWFPIEKRPEASASAIGRALPVRLTAFHWHGDRFAIPAGAIPLYRSAACENQGFVYRERVVGLQFHLETTPASAAALVRHCADELRPGPYIQSAREILDPDHDYGAMHAAMGDLIGALSESGRA